MSLVNSCSCFSVDAYTTPFKTAIPATAIKPTPAGIEKGRPLRIRAMTPPDTAKGTTRNTPIA
jgi:hypothetical protein